MNQSTINNIKVWIGKTWEEYIQNISEGMSRVEYDGNLSGDWDSGTKIRVSKIGSVCPKYNAGIANRQIERPQFTLNQLWKFQIATRAAETVYESLQWGCETNSFLGFEAEYRVEEHWSGLAGTLDGLLVNKLSGRQIPIEVKRTDANKFKDNPKGISYHQFLQTVGEMVLLSKEKDNFGYCEFGFIFTIYSDDSDPMYRIWTVVYDEEKIGWYLVEGDAVTNANNDWTRDYAGRPFISVAEYQILIENYRIWMEECGKQDVKTFINAPYDTMFDSWHCGKAIAPDHYKTNSAYGNKGDVKRGTGIYKVKCPLFNSCYGLDLEAAGYNVNEIPMELPLSFNEDGNLELANRSHE